MAEPRSHFAAASFHDGQVALVGGRGPTEILILALYDLRRRLIAQIRPDGTRVTTNWGADNFGTRVQDGNDNRFRYTYDDLGRTLSVDIERGPGIVGTTRQHFTYDGRGQILTGSDNNDPVDPADDHLLRYRYDSLGRVREVRQDGFTLTGEYDVENLLERLAHSDGARVSYERVGLMGCVGLSFNRQEAPLKH